jgi:hypothetical protein
MAKTDRLSPALQKELEALEQMPDDAIDTSDIPEEGLSPWFRCPMMWRTRDRWNHHRLRQPDAGG